MCLDCSVYLLKVGKQPKVSLIMSINIGHFKLHLLGACTIVARLLEHSFIHELWCHIIQYCQLTDSFVVTTKDHNTVQLQAGLSFYLLPNGRLQTFWLQYYLLVPDFTFQSVMSACK